MVNEAQLAELTNKLQAPMIVGNILNGQETLSGTNQMALHEVISDLQPDSSLLAIALSTRKITSFYQNASPGIKILDRECAKIINDYAEIWLENADGGVVSQEAAFETLENIADDLDGLSALFNLAIPFLKAKDETAADLFKVFGVQADAQSLIAESVLDSMNTNTYNKSVSDNKSVSEKTVETLTRPSVVKSCNVISFPFPSPSPSPA